MDLAAAASSPHIISLTTMSPACSSVRRMGRPTIEGNWCSGKFWLVSLGSRLGGRGDLYLGGISDFEETGSSVEDCVGVSMGEVRTEMRWRGWAYQWACPP